MSKKNNLLTVGDICKLTGATIKSIRYYNQIGLLEPVFVDPDSGYRYYAYEQLFLVDILVFCVELDIPLKDIKKFIHKNRTIDYPALLTYGKRIANEKMKRLQKGIEYIETAEQKIALAKKHHRSEKIYSRDIPQKFYFVVPCDEVYGDTDQSAILKGFYNFDYDDDDYGIFTEQGLLNEYSPDGVKRYAFMELPKFHANESVVTIPCGTYYCKQCEAGQIENSQEIFQKQLKGAKSFFAIESEIFSSRSVVDSPVHELRILVI